MKLDKQAWIRILAIDMLFLCFSVNISLLGQMFDPLITFYGIGLSEGGKLLSMQSVGGLLLSLVCILFIRVLNKTKLMVICGLALCTALTLTGLLPPLFLLFIMYILMGFSGGAINALANSVMVDTAVSRTERYLTFMHMLFSLGSVIAPVVSQALYPAVGLRGVFLIFGSFTLFWAVYAVFAFRREMKPRLFTGPLPFTAQLHGAWDVLKTPGMGITFIISMLVTAWQLSVIYYISSYFTGLTGNAMQGAFALSLLFLGMMISRLLYARIADKYSKGRVLLLTNAVGLLAWITTMLVPDLHVKYVFLALTAMACGNNFPIAFSTACRIVPHNTAAASGFVNLGYYIAIFTIIPLTGELGEMFGLNNALLGCALPLLLILPAALILHGRLKKNPAPEKTHDL